MNENWLVRFVRPTTYTTNTTWTTFLCCIFVVNVVWGGGSVVVSLEWYSEGAVPPTVSNA